jgi:hypothetical protein
MGGTEGSQHGDATKARNSHCGLTGWQTPWGHSKVGVRNRGPLDASVTSDSAKR